MNMLLNIDQAKKINKLLKFHVISSVWSGVQTLDSLISQITNKFQFKLSINKKALPSSLH